MKKRIYFYSLFVLFCSCDKFYPFTVYNNSDYPVVIFPQKFDNLETTCNPYHSRHPECSFQTAFPGEWVVINSWNRWDDEASAMDSGYIKIYVTDTTLHEDTLCIYYMDEWSIKKNNSVVYFPPSEEMRDIKMWPPYGTYDENGHRVAQ